MPKVSRKRRSSKTTRGRHTARRKTAAVVNPRPKRRARRTYAANPRPRRRRSVRRNPAELMELGALMANPLTKTQQRYARAMRSRTGGHQSMRTIAEALDAKPGEVSYFFRKKKSKKSKKKSVKKSKKGKGGKKSKKHTKKHSKKNKNRRASRVLRFHVPKGRKVGKVRVEFNPKLNWYEFKEAAKVAGFATLGFVGASLLTNLASSKLFGSGTGLAVGPLKSPTVVSMLIAVATPFLPIQAPWKKDLVTGVMVHAISRLIRDIIPAGSGVQMHLPGTMGEFAMPWGGGPYDRAQNPYFGVYGNPGAVPLSTYVNNTDYPGTGDTFDAGDDAGRYPDSGTIGVYTEQTGFSYDDDYTV